MINNQFQISMSRDKDRPDRSCSQWQRTIQNI